jgi:hypothetical protein
VRADLAAERTVHRGLDRGLGAEARREVEDLRPRLDERGAVLEVRVEIGAAEAVDRLLRIADDEELSARRQGRVRIGDARIRRREQSHDLVLHRVGVLHLVDEHVAEARLQARAHRAVLDEHTPQLEEQIGVVDDAAVSLLGLVRAHGVAELGPERGRELAVGVAAEALEHGHRAIELREHLLAAPLAEHLRLAALGVGAREAHEARLDPFEVAHAREPLRECTLVERADHPVEGLVQVVPRGDLRDVHLRARVVAQRAQPLDRRDRLGDARLALEPRAAPRRVEVALLGEARDDLDQRRAQRVRVARRPAQPATERGRRRVQALLEPARHDAIEQLRALVLREHAEARIEPGLDGVLAQEIGGEPVDRADARELELGDRALEARTLHARRRRVLGGARLDREDGRLERLARAERELARRRLGEGGGHEARCARAPAPQEAHDARDERGGLAGARGRLDDERRVEILGDAPSRFGIDERARGRHVLGSFAHGRPRSVTSGSRRRSSPFCAARSAASGPQIAT